LDQLLLNRERIIYVQSKLEHVCRMRLGCRCRSWRGGRRSRDRDCSSLRFRCNGCTSEVE